MITSIQGVSEGGGAATVSPLHVWGSLSQAAQMQVSLLANQSSITALGAGRTVAPLTYDAIDLVQTFSPNFSAPGLNAVQQQELAAALGLTASSTSTDVLDAINALLIPADASQAQISVLVGDANAATAEANPTNQFLYNDQGVIEGVPGSSVSQARDAVLGTLLETTANTANTLIAGGMTENPLTAGTGVAANNVQVESLNLVLAEQVAMAENAAVVANPAGADVAAATAAAVAGAAPAAEPVANMAVVENIAITANSAGATAPTVNTQTASAVAVKTATAAAAAPATTAATTATPVAIAAPAIAATNAAIIAPATIATNPVTAAAIAAPATITTNPLTPAATAATPITTTPVAAALTTTDGVDAATQTLQSLPAANEVLLPGNLPEAGVNVAAVQTAVVAAPAVIGLGTAAEVAIPSAPAVASAAPAFTPAAPALTTANTIPIIRFDNARSVLQSLLAEAAAHAIMVQRNPASATYSVGGALFQMNTDADHLQQYTTKGNLPGMRDMTRPISRGAALRGSRERQT